MRDFFSLLKNYFYYYQWIFDGRKIPPQTLFKRKRLKTLAKIYSCNIFVETGTAEGKTLKYLNNSFDKLYSIEVYEPNYLIAKERNLKYKNVKIFFGDSAKLLPEIISSVVGRTIFWLDGHYSGTGTGKSDTNCPILNEIEAIKKMSRNDHIILIDDARLFTGMDDYPILEKIFEELRKINSGYKIEVDYDCIIATL